MEAVKSYVAPMCEDVELCPEGLFARSGDPVFNGFEEEVLW